MQEEKIFAGATEEEIWQQLSQDLDRERDLLEYRAILQQQDRSIVLDIDIDPGGGFESGYALTSFTAPLKTTTSFRFSIHEQDLIEEAGKLFGMQDVVTGFPEFDKKVIVKTNDEERVKALFAEEDARTAFEDLADFRLKIKEHDTDGSATDTFLELKVEDGITSTDQLRKLYHAFVSILMKLDS